MSLLDPAGRAVRRFRSLLAKPGLDDEIAGELAFHLEMLARDYAARGLSPAAAAAAARRRFGDLARVRAACAAAGLDRDRTRRRAVWLAELGRDLQLAARRLGEGRGTAWLAVATLAAGLAAAGTAWQIEQAVLRPPAVAEPASLVQLRQMSPHGDSLAVAADDFVDWRRLNRSCLGMAAFETLEANLAGGPPGEGAPPAPSPTAAPPASPPSLPAAPPAAPPPERVIMARATPSLLPLLGVRPLLGRGFTVAESVRRADRRVALLSHGLWRRRYAADPRVVGSTVEVDGRPVRVIGVLPAGFAAPPGVELWLPLAAPSLLHETTRGHYLLAVLARLRPRVTLGAAAADLAAAAAEIGRRLPAERRGWGVTVAPLPAAWAGERWPRRARLLLAAGALLWLLASGSAANLLWARAAARQRELDLRAALGGGRGRVVRQLLAEGLLVAALAAAFGLLGAGAAGTALRRLAADLPPLAALGGQEAAPPASAPAPPAGGGAASGGPLALLPHLDAASAALVLGLAALSALLCTVGPALQALRPGPAATARQGARLGNGGERRLRDLLVVAELAGAVTLLTAAGLLVASYRRLDRAAPGFDADHLLTMRFALNGDSYSKEARRVLAQRLDQELARLPGVAAAGLVSTAPLAADALAEPFTLFGPAAGACGGAVASEWRMVTPGAFGALGLRRVAGRLLGPADRDGAHPVAVIDETLAARCWPAANPLGQRLRWPAAGRDLTVVGVVAGLSDMDLEAGPRPAVLLPYAVRPWREMALVVRPSGGGGAGLAGAVRRAVAALDPGLPLGPPRSLARARRQAVAAPRLGSWMVSLFALGALALAASGVMASAAAAVERRTPEIAVRQALGAARRDVMRLILGRSAALIALGSFLGLGGALLFARLLDGLLYPAAAAAGAPGIPSALEDAAVYAAAALLLAGVAALASALPARRAAGIAPVLALRRD